MNNTENENYLHNVTNLRNECMEVHVVGSVSCDVNDS